MSEEKNEWEIRMEEAVKETWSNMSDHQQWSVLKLLKAWVPVRSRVVNLSSIDVR